MQGSSRELLLLFFYYSWNIRILKMEIRINKYIRANSFFVNSFFSREIEKKILIVNLRKIVFSSHIIIFNRDKSSILIEVG